MQLLKAFWDFEAGGSCCRKTMLKEGLNVEDVLICVSALSLS